jgi:predicted pyridoxine 5'-phosphate oxidase superfamily flavin-nucleotide-binding protein
MYGDGSRGLQDAFDSRRLADRLEELTVHDELNDDDIDLIGTQSTVWLATVDTEGWPDVSYKGGDPGFVQVISPTEVRIPIFNGNGQWRSLGNIVDTGKVALLFVDPERPWRIRIHGTAEVLTGTTDLAGLVGAQAVVKVTIGRVFPNCGRYIHQDGVISKNVPRDDVSAPIPEWKTFEFIRDALPAKDLAEVEAAEADGELND